MAGASPTVSCRAPTPSPRVRGLLLSEYHEQGDVREHEGARYGDRYKEAKRTRFEPEHPQKRQHRREHGAGQQGSHSYPCGECADENGSDRAPERKGSQANANEGAVR